MLLPVMMRYLQSANRQHHISVIAN